MVRAGQHAGGSDCIHRRLLMGYVVRRFDEPLRRLWMATNFNDGCKRAILHVGIEYMG